MFNCDTTKLKLQYIEKMYIYVRFSIYVFGNSQSSFLFSSVDKNTIL